MSRTRGAALRRAALAAVLGVAVAPDLAAELNATAELATLKAEIARLSARVAELEERLATPADADATTDSATTTAPPATADAIEVTDAAVIPRGPRVSVGGRVKLDVVFSDTSRGRGAIGDTLLAPGAIALDATGESDQLDWSARASRLWLKSWQTTPWGDAGAYLELDLLGSGGDQRVSNGYGARLRHGYGELGGLLFGQTYSTFVDVGALPELNDDGISAGSLNVRQPLLRYQHVLGAGTVQLAFEAPETTLTAADGTRLSPDDDRLPDVMLRYQRDDAFGQWSLATMVRELRIDDAAGGARDSAVGAAASLSGMLRFGVRDGLRFTAVGGNAVGRYLAFNAFDGGRLDANGNITLTPMAGGMLSWQHLWDEHWRSNLTAGYAWADDDGAHASANASLYTVHANLLWSPVAHTTLGLEWIHAYRRLVDGRTGSLQRLQFSAVHKF